MNLYEILEIEKTATQEDIRKAYKLLAKSAHPDKGGDADTFSKIKEAHDILMDAKAREYYDNTGQIDKNSFEKRFKDVINQVFIQMIYNHGTAIDIIDEFGSMINNNILAAHQKKRDSIANLDTFEKIKSQVKFSGIGRDYIGEEITMNINHLKKIECIIDAEIEFLEEVRKKVKEYKFQTIEQQLIGRRTRR